jgi:hypothetical protein
MQKSQLPFEIFEEIVETAGLWLVPAEESSDGDTDSVRLRKSYNGRGYASGFGVVVESNSALYRFMAAAGMVATRRDMDGLASFEVDSFAKMTATDAMGRSGTIVYWHNWEVTDVPDEYSRD